MEPTTSPAARAASSAACSRTSRPLEALTATCLVAEVLGLVEVAAVVVVVVVVALDGNPVTGYALGQGAMSTTLLAGWSVSNAMHPETLLASLLSDHGFSIFGQGKSLN